MKRETAHKQKRFLNCLRIQVVPEYFEERRIQSIVGFCEKYAFDNVMLFINAEEYCTGHMTKEEAKPWIEAMKRTKKLLLEAGITVSLNPWIEFGHLDRGRILKEGQHFVTQVDYNGTACEMVACPMDNNWQKYYLDFYEYIIRELEPEVVWVEDDFRLHNHGFLEYGGCFCEHHMNAYNQALGTDYSRDEFVELLFRGKPDECVKKAFLDVNRRCMVDLAELIGKKVKQIGLGTKIALMSSMHQYHSMEGRDWEGIHRGLAQGGPMINRLHLPMYMENVSMKVYYYNFNLVSFICRKFLPEKTHVLPELENASFMTYAKDSETLRFQLESALPLQIEGMTYDIFDYAGNGAIEAFGYGKVVKEITPYLTAVMDSGYAYKSLQGVVIPTEERSAYNRPIRNSIYDLYPDEYYFGAILQTHGISAKCSKEKVWKDEIVVLSAGSVFNFTDAQLEALFANNKVIMEGMAAMHLIDRGLGNLIGAEKYRVYISDMDVQSYEQIEGARLVHGIPGYRASAFSRTGDYVAIKYCEIPDVQSRVYDYNHNELGYGNVIAKGHLIVPYIINNFYPDQLHPLRKKILCDYIENQEKLCVRTNYTSVYAYYSTGNKNVLILVNSTLNNFLNTKFKLIGETVNKVYEIDRDGIIREKEFTYDEEGFVTINEEFRYISTKTFLVE